VPVATHASAAPARNSAHAVRTARTTARRERLLDELIELFLAEGFRAFGVGDLATRLRCSRSTIYLVAGSKEQIVLAAVRAFFRRAAERIEAQVALEPDPGARLAVYLTAVAAELSPASERFYADLQAYAPAAEIYGDNTRLAARRVQDLVNAGVSAGALRPVDASFVGAAVALVMAGIQDGSIGTATGLADAAAYRNLADLVVHGLGGSTA
jgi:AcrR family transcriptional regulator